MDKKISYASRTFNDYKASLENLTKQYYPDLAESLNDASVGSFLIDLNAAVADNLSYYIDRALQETNIDSAQEPGSLNNIARTNGVKIPGRKGAMTEVAISCVLPLTVSTTPNSSAQEKHPNWAYAPLIKKGTKFSAGDQVFELDKDVDFKHQFDEDGVSNRTFIPLEDSYGKVTSYRVTKYTSVIAGETKIYKKVIKVEDIKPFFEVTLPFDNIMGIESIIFKDGDDFQTDPTFSEFLVKEEYTAPTNSTSGRDIYRFFEVDNLAQQYRWGDVTDKHAQPVKYFYGYHSNGVNVPTFSITKGEWKPVRQKFVTEFTDKNYLKITFGSGYGEGMNDVDISKATENTKYLISKMINNDALGVLPKAGTTMYVLYRVGGGASSNLAEGAINSITTLNASIGDGYDASKLSTEGMAAVRRSLTVTNTIPSVSGRDALDPSEIRNFIKYNNGAKDRCVTVKDYHARILDMPYKYGSAYRVGVTEENNKIMVYLLGLDENGYLTTVLPSQYVNNLINYLSEYRMINDFIEMKSGKIVNLSFEVDVYIDKSYNASDVMASIRKLIADYMNINKHQMGDEVFLGDLQKEISKLDGVINLIDLRVYNEYDESAGYSSTQTTQRVYTENDCTGISGYMNEEGNYCRTQLNLKDSDYILYSENDTMMEIKYPEGRDIRIRCKTR